MALIKGIKVSEETLLMLKRLKREGETYDDTIRRIAKFYASVNEMTDEELVQIIDVAEHLEKSIKEGRLGREFLVKLLRHADRDWVFRNLGLKEPETPTPAVPGERRTVVKEEKEAKEPKLPILQ